MPRDGALTLSDVRDPALSIVCEPCGRRETYDVARLMERHGDAKLTDLLQTLANCPKARSVSIHDRCRAVFERLSLWPSALAKLLPESELADAQAQMTPEQYAQEYLCSFDAAILGAYYGKLVAEIERAGHITEVPKAEDIPVQTAWDLGISANGMMAIWVFPGRAPVVAAKLDRLSRDVHFISGLMAHRSHM